MIRQACSEDAAIRVEATGNHSLSRDEARFFAYLILGFSYLPRLRRNRVMDDLASLVQESR